MYQPPKTKTRKRAEKPRDKKTKTPHQSRNLSAAEAPTRVLTSNATKYQRLEYSRHATIRPAQQHNYLFENQRNGTFREVAHKVGLALSRTGKARAGMGIDFADIDHSGRESLVIGNFDSQMLGLYHNRGGAFVDVAPDGRAIALGFHATGQVSFRAEFWSLSEKTQSRNLETPTQHQISRLRFAHSSLHFARNDTSSASQKS